MDHAQNHKLSNQDPWICLTQNEVSHIFIFYVVLLFISLIGVFLSLIILQAICTDEMVLITCISFSGGVLGGTFYYIRKLYKSCIQKLVTVDASDSTQSIVALGAKVYFYLRPVMGAILATLFSYGVYGGFFMIQDQPAPISNKFYIFIILLSFCIGFSNGKIIVQLDKSKEKIVEILGVEKRRE